MDPKKSIGDHIRQVAAYSILLTVFGMGLAIGTGFWSSTVSGLNSQLGEYRTELNKKSEELTQVKSDYLSYKLKHPLISTSGEKASDTGYVYGHKSKGGSDSTTESPIPNGRPTETRRIDSESSAQFLGGALTISLVATPFEGSPLRHKVIANINTENGESARIDNKDIGYVIKLGTSKKYRVTVVAAETFSATFKVTEQQPVLSP